MTPAIKLLKKLKIGFQVLSYQHDNNETSYANEAATKLDLPPEQVFKTLVIETSCKSSNEYCVAILPSTQQADMKAIAKLMAAKKANLAPANKVQNMTGYILGGVSPFAQKRQLKTFIDQSALAHETIYVSAGKRGLEIELEPTLMADILKASFKHLSAS